MSLANLETISIEKSGPASQLSTAVAKVGTTGRPMRSAYRSRAAMAILALGCGATVAWLAALIYGGLGMLLTAASYL